MNKSIFLPTINKVPQQQTIESPEHDIIYKNQNQKTFNFHE